MTKNKARMVTMIETRIEDACNLVKRAVSDLELNITNPRHGLDATLDHTRIEAEQALRELEGCRRRLRNID